jgi:putative hemolysin
MNSDSSLVRSILLLLCFILIGSCFSCAEISLLTINRNKLEGLSQKGNKKAKRLYTLLGEPAKFLAAIQVGNTVTGFLASAFAADNFAGILTEFLYSTGIKVPYNTLNTISVIAIILVVAYVSMVLGELVPKRVGMKKADTLALIFAEPVRFISKIFAPVVWLLIHSTNGLLRVFGIDPGSVEKAITEEEIRLMIDLGSAGGVIKSGEKEILQNIFEFDNKTAGEVMTHRRDVTFLNLGDSDEEWEKAITAKRHSNYPVAANGPDHITGILNVRDYLILKDRSRQNVLDHTLRPAHFVPLSVKTDRLFWQMKKTRNHFSVVVDEHGSMRGIVTMNDLLEQLVGDLEDDSSAPQEGPDIESAGEDRWYVNGTISLDKISRELGVELPLEKYDTFAGFVFSLLGHIPEDGIFTESAAPELEVPQFDAPWKLTIKILEVRDHRLEKAMVKKTSV